VLRQLAAWFHDYNEHHLHRGLGMRSPSPGGPQEGIDTMRRLREDERTMHIPTVVCRRVERSTDDLVDHDGRSETLGARTYSPEEILLLSQELVTASQASAVGRRAGPGSVRFLDAHTGT
jgi:hypothetical protein